MNRYDKSEFKNIFQLLKMMEKFVSFSKAFEQKLNDPNPTFSKPTNFKESLIFPTLWGLFSNSLPFEQLTGSDSRGTYYIIPLESTLSHSHLNESTVSEMLRSTVWQLTVGAVFTNA